MNKFTNLNAVIKAIKSAKDSGAKWVQITYIKAKEDGSFGNIINVFTYEADYIFTPAGTLTSTIRNSLCIDDAKNNNSESTHFAIKSLESK